MFLETLILARPTLSSPLAGPASHNGQACIHPQHVAVRRKARLSEGAGADPDTPRGWGEFYPSCRTPLGNIALVTREGKLR